MKVGLQAYLLWWLPIGVDRSVGRNLVIAATSIESLSWLMALRLPGVSVFKVNYLSKLLLLLFS